MPVAVERALALLAGVWFVNLVNFMDGIDWITVAGIVPLTARAGAGRRRGRARSGERLAGSGAMRRADRLRAVQQADGAALPRRCRLAVDRARHRLSALPPGGNRRADGGADPAALPCRRFDDHAAAPPGARREGLGGASFAFLPAGHWRTASASARSWRRSRCSISASSCWRRSASACRDSGCSSAASALAVVLTGDPAAPLRAKAVRPCRAERVLVTGASGFIGPHVVARAARGRLSRPRRPAPGRARAPEGAEAVVTGDLARPVDWRPALDGVQPCRPSRRPRPCRPRPRRGALPAHQHAGDARAGGSGRARRRRALRLPVLDQGADRRLRRAAAGRDRPARARRCLWPLEARGRAGARRGSISTGSRCARCWSTGRA